MPKARAARDPGRMISVMPTNPTPIAAQRRQPTRSPSSGPESATTSSGPKAKTACVRASPIRWKARIATTDLQRQANAARDLYGSGWPLLQSPP